MLALRMASAAMTEASPPIARQVRIHLQLPPSDEYREAILRGLDAQSDDWKGLLADMGDAAHMLRNRPDQKDVAWLLDAYQFKLLMLLAPEVRAATEREYAKRQAQAEAKAKAKAKADAKDGPR
ncbi:hypothetical protein [Luteimonas sp. e5]